MNIINISLSVEELKTIVSCMGDYLSLHISSDYEAAEVKERLEGILSIYEGRG